MSILFKLHLPITFTKSLGIPSLFLKTLNNQFNDVIDASKNLSFSKSCWRKQLLHSSCQLPVAPSLFLPKVYEKASRSVTDSYTSSVCNLWYS